MSRGSGIPQDRSLVTEQKEGLERTRGRAEGEQRLGRGGKRASHQHEDLLRAVEQALAGLVRLVRLVHWRGGKRDRVYSQRAEV